MCRYFRHAVLTGDEFKMVCTVCPAGRFGTNHTKDKECSGACPVGRFAALGSAACGVCPAGRYQAEKAQATCHRCPRGKFSALPKYVCARRRAAAAARGGGGGGGGGVPRSVFCM